MDAMPTMSAHRIAITRTPRSTCIHVLVLIAGFFLGKGLFAQDLEGLGKQKPVQVNGSLSLLGGPYFYAGDGAPRNKPFFWNSNGSITLSLYGVQMPFSFSVGSQQSSYTQPFNRYGVSPHYKWVKLHAGYRSMRFNPYTLGGLQFFGGGIELDPKGFRFAAFYGRFNKPVAQDTLAAISPIPAYKRMGYGMKVGVGSARNHVDLMMIHVQDDSSSITAPERSRIRPMENLALGLSGRIGITKKLIWTFDGGASAISDDARLAENTDVDVPDLARGLFTPRFGSRAAFGGNTGLQWTSRFLTLKVSAKQVDPDYRSLGAVFQQTDVRAITVDPSIRFNKSKWRLSGSIGRQQDNIRNTKLSQSIRTIGSAAVSWNPSRTYGTDLNYSNYGIQQQRGLQVLNDTFRVAMANRSYSVSQRYVKSNSKRSLTASLVGGYQQLQDLNSFGTFNTSENEVIYANLYVGRARTRDNFGLTGGLNYSRNAASFGASVLIGPSVGTSLQLAKKKLMTSANLSWNKAFQNGEPSGSTINFSASAQYKLSTSQSFQCSASVLRNETSFVASQKFTEIRFQAGYVFYLRSRS
ncbi:MAG: hypothetical protein IPN44_12715 [Flavobacteriales bacterium]|nr:hypothetical protein [Flavobacteriales bacterium]